MPSVTITDSPTSQFEAASNVMVITEMHGLKRSVTLSLTSLPRKGVGFGMELVAPVRFHPGSIEGTQQILGFKIPPTTMGGVWKRNWLGRRPVLVEQDGTEVRVIYPNVVKELFEDILKRASLLRVVWQFETRYGRITSMNFPVDTAHDINWEFTFEWIARSELFPERIVKTREGGTEAMVEGILVDSDNLGKLDGVEIAVSDRSPRPPGAPELTLGQINALVNAPNDVMQAASRKVREATSALKEVTDIASALKNHPTVVANTVMAMCENVVAQCNQMHDELTRNPYETNGVDHRVSSLLNTCRYYDSGIRLSESLKRKAQDLRDQQARRSDVQKSLPQSDVLAMHLVVKGDTLTGLSARYYRSPDYGHVIAKANNILYPNGAASATGGRATIGGKNLLVIPVLRK